MSRALLALMLAACASPTAPGIEVIGAQEFTPPASYTDVAAALFACANDERDPAAFVASSRWFTVARFDDQRDGLRFPIYGLWRPGEGIYLLDATALRSVAHELNHLRLRGDSRHADASWSCAR